MRVGFCIINIHIAAKYMQLGYRIRRPSWRFLSWISWSYVAKLTRDDLLADDWEIVIDGIIQDFPITYQD